MLVSFVGGAVASIGYFAPVPIALIGLGFVLVVLGSVVAGVLAYRSARYYGGTIRGALWRGLRTMLSWLFQF